ncbi:cell division protein FtsA [Novosphingopyxis sp. YJ-S2-01]|uniref:cell division protein FtsA n=1 Tax=Novosphingopyxis sp. YJ-S2-01 TaxID=2794021 RepID=UPI0018DB226B|nr:cell division protein FtsA [Novosphingopyxis sp. YJ-S2-01]MBH9537624.1 cell division protein FtsA [Novosphingopyxis sp. YJ-S2-01]
MPAPKVERLITALDIGSSKISALIAGVTEEGKLTVLGTGQRESRGVKRGYVTDVQAAELAVRTAVEQAERMAGINIDRVHVAFSAGGLTSRVTTMEVDLSGHRVAQEHVDYLLASGQQGIDPEGKLILHAQPALYTLDGVEGIRNPKGLHADQLSVDIHVLLGDPAPVRNIDMTVRAAHLEVDAVVAAPIAAGMACLTEEERELGVALVELGASVTNVALFAGGMLVDLATIPFGAADITDDIASAFGIRRMQAERMKCFHGSALTNPRDNHDVIDVDRGHNEEEPAEGGRVTKAQLNSVIRQRLDHLIGEIRGALKDLGFSGPVGRQVVLTGGGAELKGIADYAQSALGRTVRIGKPAGLRGLPEAHAGPAFGTLAGLILYAKNEPLDLRSLSTMTQQSYRQASPGLVQRLVHAFRANF